MLKIVSDVHMKIQIRTSYTYAEKSRLCSTPKHIPSRYIGSQLGDNETVQYITRLHVHHLAPYENCYKNIIYIKKARAI